MPEAVTHAITDKRLPASDGHTYTPGQGGQWNAPGMLYGTNPASGNVRDELNATQRAEPATPPAPTRAAVPSAHTSESVHVPPPNLQASHAQTQPASPAPLRLDHPDHPGHALFQQARTAVHRLDKEQGRTPDKLSENLAGALTAQAKVQGLKRIDDVALSQDGRRVFATHHSIPGAYNATAHVEAVKAVNMPLERSTVTYQQAAQSQAQAPHQMQQVQQGQASHTVQR
ncbi:MAG: XVIPCD domain-containing protein [Rhodanobacter sp.]